MTYDMGFERAQSEYENREPDEWDCPNWHGAARWCRRCDEMYCEDCGEGCPRCPATVNEEDEGGE
jgi:hypothetical protein